MTIAVPLLSLMITNMIKFFFHSELDRSKESVGEVENLMDMPLSMVKFKKIIIILIIIIIVIICITGIIFLTKIDTQGEGGFYQRQ